MHGPAGPACGGRSQVWNVSSVASGAFDVAVVGPLAVPQPRQSGRFDAGLIIARGLTGGWRLPVPSTVYRRA